MGRTTENDLKKQMGKSLDRKYAEDKNTQFVTCGRKKGDRGRGDGKRGQADNIV